MIVDTSVWVDHLREGVPPLREHLEEGVVMVHPFVMGELACGNLRDRSTVLGLLAGLPLPVVADHAEVLGLVESRELYGRGIGWVDMHLLASALLTNVVLWSHDRRLVSVAGDLGLA